MTVPILNPERIAQPNQTWRNAQDTGSLFGMTVAVLGEDGPQNWELPNGLVVNASNAWPAFQSFLKLIDIEWTINYVSALSASRFKDKKGFEAVLERNGVHAKSILRDYQFSIILTQLLSQPDASREGGHQTNATDLANLGAMIIGSRCEADESDDVPAFIQRFSFQQFWDQEDYSTWPRGVLIQREMNKILRPSDRFDLNQSFLGLYGLTLDNFMFLSFATFSLAISQPGRVFGPAQLAGSRELAIAASEAEAFFKIVSVAIPDFGAKALHPAVYLPGYEPYSLSPLLRWPAIRLSNGAHSIPIPRLMLERATIGTYYDFMPAARARFGNFWGNAFEAYVGQLLTSTPNISAPVRAEAFVSGQQICDWVVVEPEIVLLIECKTRSLSARSRITGAEEDLRRDATRAEEGDPEGSSLAKGVVQLMHTRDALEARDPGKYRYICLLLTLDKIYLGNYSDWLHRFIREGAEALYAGPLPEDFQVTDVAGFERLLQVVATEGTPITAILEAKISEFSTKELDLMTYAGQISPADLKSLPYLHDAANMSMQTLLEEFKAS